MALCFDVNSPFCLSPSSLWESLCHTSFGRQKQSMARLEGAYTSVLHRLSVVSVISLFNGLTETKRKKNEAQDIHQILLYLQDITSNQIHIQFVVPSQCPLD